MTATAIVVVSAALLIVLAGWTSGRRSREARIERPQVGLHRANPLFWLAGLLVFGAGLLVVLNGVTGVANARAHPDHFGVAGAEAQADAAGIVAWGAVMLTIGAYIWRGARRRGTRDRLGRLLIITGYLLLGVALSQSVHSAADLWRADRAAQDEQVLRATMFRFLGWGAPAALLVLLGTRMADEKVLMTAGADASS